MTRARPNIVIVGGGVGGLFVANALVTHGLEVAVYEQVPTLGEVGAGLYLTPNSVRHLPRVGLGPAVDKWGVKVGKNSPKSACACPCRQRQDRLLVAIWLPASFHHQTATKLDGHNILKINAH